MMVRVKNSITRVLLSTEPVSKINWSELIEETKRVYTKRVA